MGCDIHTLINDDADLCPDCLSEAPPLDVRTVERPDLSVVEEPEPLILTID